MEKTQPQGFVLFFLSSVLVSPENNHMKSHSYPSSNKEDEPEIVDVRLPTTDWNPKVQEETKEEQPKEKGEKEEKLDCKWTFWYQAHTQRGKSLDKSDYLRDLKKGGTVDSLASFWNRWTAVQRRQNSEDCTYHLFKTGIQPIWEDPKNFKGGKCVIVAQRTSQYEMIAQWVNLMLTLLAGEFETEVNGVVLSTRPWGNVYSVWIRNAKDQNAVEVITKKLRKIFGAQLPVKFQRHQVAIKKKMENERRSSSSSEISSEEEHDKNNRKKSVVNESTRGMLHQLIAEVSGAPVCPPVQDRKDSGREFTREAPPSQLSGAYRNAPVYQNPTRKEMKNFFEPRTRYPQKQPVGRTGNAKITSLNNRRNSLPAERVQPPASKRRETPDDGFTTALLVMGIAILVSLLSWTFL